MITIGYAATRADGLQMLADYNNNPFDTKAAKMTFQMSMKNGQSVSFLLYLNLM